MRVTRYTAFDATRHGHDQLAAIELDFDISKKCASTMPNFTGTNLPTSCECVCRDLPQRGRISQCICYYVFLLLGVRMHSFRFSATQSLAYPAGHGERLSRDMVASLSNFAIHFKKRFCCRCTIKIPALTTQPCRKTTHLI